MTHSRISKRLLLGLLLGTLLLSGKAALAQATLTIVNNSPDPFVNTVVEIPWATVLQAYPTVDTARLRVVQLPDNRELPYQLEHRGQKAVRHLLVQVSVEPRQRVQLRLLPESPATVLPKTYCRYVPERFDDFAWENDRIAFRIYGKALNGRKDNAFGTDVWAKRTDKLVLDNWYKTDDYHKDHGEGLDYYHVGFTLGAGDIGVWLGDSINYIHNYTTWQVLDNGPLRATFRVTYPAYTFAGVTVNTTKIISLDAGSQLSKVEVQLTHNHPKPLPMVVGISLRSATNPTRPNETHLGVVRFEEKKGIMSYWEPTHGADGTLGIGTVFPGPIASGAMHEQHHHALTGVLATSGAPLIYYGGAAWDKAGQITSSTDWLAYLERYAARLRQPMQIIATSGH